MLEKIKKLICKSRYITEFISTIVFILFMAQTIYYKAYAGYFHKLYLIGTGIWGAILLINIIYNFKKSNKKVEKIFLNIAIPLGMLYLVFMIPSHVPDEATHFYKAYDVSCGNIVTKIDENGNSYIKIPKNLEEYHHVKITNYKTLIEKSEEKTDYNDTVDIISTAQGNSFIMYILPALGFIISRVLNIGIIWGIYLGKVLNFIFFLIMSYLAIRKISFGKLVLAVYMLTPMNLQQVTSMSPDAFINSITLYYLAFSVYMVFKKEKVNKKEIALYIILTAISGLIKMVYVLLAGVGFLIVKRKDIKSKNKILIIVLTILIGGIFTIGAYLYTTKYSSITEATELYKQEYNVDSGKQMDQIKENPKHILKAFKTDWYDMQKDYMFMAIGSQLGWIEIKPSETIILIYLILLVVSALAEDNKFEFNKIEKTWLLLISIGIMFLVEIAMYLDFTPVGAEFIGGVQGRYYIPVYILALWALGNKNNYIKIKNSQNKFLIISGALNLCVLWEVIGYFL